MTSPDGPNDKLLEAFNEDLRDTALLANYSVTALVPFQT